MFRNIWQKVAKKVVSVGGDPFVYFCCCVCPPYWSRSGIVRRTTSDMLKLLKACWECEKDHRSARLMASQPLQNNIFQGEKNILRLWRPLFDKILRPLIGYWYMRSRGENHVYNIPQMNPWYTYNSKPSILSHYIKEWGNVLDPTHLLNKKSVGILVTWH